MAVIYCDSAGDDSDGLTWAKAKQTFAAALTAAGADGTVYIASDHVEPTSTQTYTAPAAATPIIAISADKTTGAPPTTYARGAAFAITAAGADMNFIGGCTLIGVDLTINDNITFNTNTAWTLIDCTLFGGSSGNWIVATAGDSGAIFERCVFDMDFTDFGWSLAGGMHLKFRECSLAVSLANANTLYNLTTTRGGKLTVENCDFSNGVSGYDIVGATGLPSSIAGGGGLVILITGCKLPTSGSVLADTFAEHESRLEAYNNDSADTIHSTLIQDFRGSAIDDIATTRNGTYDGTNKYSLKVEGTIESIRGVFPFRFLLAEYWAAAGKTHTVHIVSNGAITWDSADLWCEFEGPDATTGALTILATTLDIAGVNAYGLGTPAALTTDTDGAAEWAGEPGSSNFYEISHAFSADDQDGVHRVWVNFAPGAVEALFVDPQVEVSA